MPFEGCPLHFNFIKRIVSKKEILLQIFPLHLRGRVELVRVIVVCIFFDRLPANALLKTLLQSHRSSDSDIQLVEFTSITHTHLGKQSLKAEKKTELARSHSQDFKSFQATLETLRSVNAMPNEIVVLNLQINVEQINVV